LEVRCTRRSAGRREEVRRRLRRQLCSWRMRRMRLWRRRHVVDSCRYTCVIRRSRRRRNRI
jgi:hypothetical protein